MGFLAALLMVAVFQVNPIPFDQSPFQENAMLRGRVVDTDPYYPHGGISHVTIFVESAADVESTISDSKGYFYLPNLLPGTYMLAARPQYQCFIWNFANRYEFDAGYEYMAIIRLPSGCI
jgi:hypothetical protein